jgi:hypothetical protein
MAEERISRKAVEEETWENGLLGAEVKRELGMNLIELKMLPGAKPIALSQASK